MLLMGLPTSEAEAARIILDGCPAHELEPGAFELLEPPPPALFLVDDGFVALRSLRANASRSVLTSVAGPGRLLVPPAADETLESLAFARLVVLPDEALRLLLAIPSFAGAVVDGLAAALGDAQRSIANFASPKHIDRVRGKLVQLGRDYGKVGREGILIDFPLSHMLLAEMIGSSRETVTRALDELQRTGFSSRHGRTYRLLIPREQLPAPEVVRHR